MRPFVGCWVSEWVHQWVSASVALCFVDTIQTTLFARSLSNFTCKLWTMRGGTYWFWVTGSKVKVNFCTLYIRPCGQDTDYSFSPITFKLHMSLVDDKGRNPIDFGSQGKRSSSILPTCEGISHALRCLVMYVLSVVIPVLNICIHFIKPWQVPVNQILFRM